MGEKNRKRYLKIGNMSKKSYGILKKEVNQNPRRSNPGNVIAKIKIIAAAIKAMIK
jgi:hypothetical protein